jgi:hypothetical protein
MIPPVYGTTMLIAIVFALLAAPELAAGSAHRCGLQWIDGTGICRVSAGEANKLALRGKHEAKNGDFVELDGTIEAADAKSFVLVGKIVTRVSHIAGGKACPREGRFTFRAVGARKYWRMKEQENPCDPVTDYVDVYFEEVK